MMISKRTNQAGPSKLRRRQSRNRLCLNPENLENRLLLTFQNIAEPADTNLDGYVSPIDALTVVDYLNRYGAHDLSIARSENPLPGMLDFNGDGFVTPSDALGVINRLNGEGEDDSLVQIRLATTDLSDNPISTIGVGENFMLHGFVQDLTGRENGGVFAAYLDVLYNEAIVSVSGNVIHSQTYDDVPSGNTSVGGLIDEVGGVDGFDPLGTEEHLLFSIQMTADNNGAVTFTGDGADRRPLHDTLVYGTPDGEDNGIVEPDRIMFLDATLVVGTENSSPIANNDTYQTNEDTPLAISAQDGVLANDSDPNNDSITASVVSEPANGNLSLAADGSFSYTPDAGFVGQDSFTYVANDGSENSNVATANISVLPTNEAPEASNDSFSTNEDTFLATTLSVLGNDTDADNDTLTAQLMSGVSQGALTLNADGTFTYRPNDNYNGVDGFTYVASDGQDVSNLATVTINVVSVNDPPVATADSYMTGQNSQLTIAAPGLLANDTDIEGDAITALKMSDPANGSVAVNANGAMVYSPNQDFTGLDTFTYVARDTSGDTSGVTTVSINVTGDTAVIIRLDVTNVSGDPITAIDPGGDFVLAAYVRDVSALPRDGVFAAFMDVMYSQNLVSANSPITYGENYANQQSGTIRQDLGLIDEVGAFGGINVIGAQEFLLFSVPFTANAEGTAVFQTGGADNLPINEILVLGQDDPVPQSEVEYGSVSLVIRTGNPPVAMDNEYSVDEDMTLIVGVDSGVLQNDSDPDGDILRAVLVNEPINGSLNLNSNGSFNYTPNSNFTGTDIFSYVANDGATNSNPASVTISVRPVDDAPVAIDDDYFLADADLSLVVAAADGVLANDFDVEGDTLVPRVITSPANGNLDFNLDGSFTYTPSSNLVGRDQFTYQLTAGGRLSNIATVTIDVGNLSPSTLSGFVYVDTNNNGVRELGEAQLGGVRVHVSGRNLLGEEISTSTVTEYNGAYAFPELLRGHYTVTQVQPLFMIDGMDTHAGSQSLRNDRFEVDLEAGIVDGGYNFGERGLEPQFIGNHWLFASRSKNGMYAALDASGEQVWYSFDAGWSGLTYAEVDLSSNRSTLELTATTTNNFIDTEIIRVTGNRDVRIVGNMQRGMLVYFGGSAADFGISQGAEGELDSSAVDRIFEGG